METHAEKMCMNICETDLDVADGVLVVGMVVVVEAIGLVVTVGMAVLEELVVAGEVEAVDEAAELEELVAAAEEEELGAVEGVAVVGLETVLVGAVEDTEVEVVVVTTALVIVGTAPRLVKALSLLGPPHDSALLPLHVIVH